MHGAARVLSQRGACAQHVARNGKERAEQEAHYAGPRESCTERLVCGTVGRGERRDLVSRCGAIDVCRATVAVDSTCTSDDSGAGDGNRLTCTAQGVARISGLLPPAVASGRRVQMVRAPNRLSDEMPVVLSVWI